MQYPICLMLVQDDLKEKDTDEDTESAVRTEMNQSNNNGWGGSNSRSNNGWDDDNHWGQA